MPLAYLLFRCPHCGHDPMGGEKDEAVCPGCGIRFSRGGEGGMIRVEEPSGKAWEVPGHRLTAAIMWALGDGDGRGSAPAGFLIHQAEVAVRQSGAESPVWHRGELLGFAEALGEQTSGILELTPEALVLQGGTAQSQGPGGGNSHEIWPLLEIRAVQTSSSSLQFSPSSGGLVEFRFPNDSPFRWENLLRSAIRKAYRKHGLGEIVEFQPRIVAE